MVRFTPLVSAACLLSPGAVARFLGPMDPAPVDIASSKSVVYAAWQNITAGLDALAGSDLGNYTFSVGLFSAHDAAAQTAYQYHHTGPEVAGSKLGVDSVDGDSVYRVASISKLVTALAGVLRLNESEWQRPLTEIFPEIAELAAAAAADDDDGSLGRTRWDQITPRALVSQITGLVQNAFPLAPDYPAYEEAGHSVPCADLYCSALDFITGMATAHRSFFGPWTTPAYSNANFILLGLSLMRLTNQTLEELFQEAVFEPLGMADTSVLPPTGDETFAGYVVAGPLEVFAADGGITSGSGGVFSTTNDLARLGVGILNATLLGEARTREWMKPVAFTGSDSFALGMGWEIYRYTHAGTGAITDLYTKLGSSGAYAGYEVLVPDYGAGFSVLLANGEVPSLLEAQAAVADVVSAALLPALQAQAAVEARRNLAGTYKSAVEGVEASLELVYNETATPGAGLTIASFEAAGEDVLLAFYAKHLVLQPAIHSAGTPERLSFQATVVMPTLSEEAEAEAGLFSKLLIENSDFLENPTYMGMGVKTFEFDLQADGKAAAVTVPALGVSLKKVKEY